MGGNYGNCKILYRYLRILVKYIYLRAARLMKPCNYGVTMDKGG